MTSLFLPGIDDEFVRERLAAAGGNELGSGKFAHPESSAALAVNAFGWFAGRADMFPPLAGTDMAGAAEVIDIEFCARFPWPGGRHPWLDAAILTRTHLMGVESKRYEPFRDTKRASFAAAYDRPVWGDRMGRYEAVRDLLRVGALRFMHLDAAQLVKHAFGLVTEARRCGKLPVLFYIFAEPAELNGKQISAGDLAQHREEILAFAQAVAGDEVLFLASSYREWFSTWPDDPRLLNHRTAVISRFDP